MSQKKNATGLSPRLYWSGCPWSLAQLKTGTWSSSFLMGSHTCGLESRSSTEDGAALSWVLEGVDGENWWMVNAPICVISCRVRRI